MKVMLRKNIYKLGEIGDVVDVKPGYARNYLLPHGIAVEPTKANTKRIEAEKQLHLAELAKRSDEIKALAASIEGKEITISAMANEEGHLYGSVGPAQLVAALAEDGIFVEPGNIVLDSPIRRLDKYDVQVQLAPDVTAAISVWVVPSRETADLSGPASPPPEDSSDPAAEQDQPAATDTTGSEDDDTAEA